MKITDFTKYKLAGRKISMLTCYDFWTANIVENSSIDSLLVGDSLSMVMHGHDSTVTATMDMMELHTQAIARGAPSKFIVGDMPFLSSRGSLDKSVDKVIRLMRVGAQAVKIEGVRGNEALTNRLVESGGVWCAGHGTSGPDAAECQHAGRIQGPGQESQQVDEITEQALLAQELGCFSMVLECVPETLGKSLSQALEIPVIGIGASDR